jgi:hypothetical protein
MCVEELREKFCHIVWVMMGADPKKKKKKKKKKKRLHYISLDILNILLF